MYIYALRLETGKYYIGKTVNPEYRIEQHFNTGGSSWTTLYPPMDVINITEEVDAFDEDKHTLKMMEEHGIENVRGGSFSSIDITQSKREIIESMINTKNDTCYVCGEPGHFADKCDVKCREISIITPPIITPPIITPPSEKSIINEKTIVKTPDKKCKCVASWVTPHKQSNCKLKKTLNGLGKLAIGILKNLDTLIDEPGSNDIKLDDVKPNDIKLDDVKLDDVKPNDVKLDYKKTDYKKTNYKKPNAKKSCTRCGRNSHMTGNCYATKHLRGNYINSKKRSTK